MNKPNDFDKAVAFGEYETLPAGGYKCIIKGAKCEKAQNGKEYLKLAIDIAEGEYKDFYKKKYDNDSRIDKKWSGVWAIFIEGYEAGTTNPKFKGLTTSLEVSNSGYKWDWKEDSLKDKKIGIVFREEEFESMTDGQIHTAVKPFYAVSIDNVESAKIPNIKKLATKENTANVFTAEEVNDLPWN